MRLLYTGLLYLITPLVLLRLLWKSLELPDYRRRIAERFGFVPRVEGGLTYMMEDPRMIGPCTHLLFGAKNFERIGDHATNIAENIHYLVSGQPMREERPKKDTTSTTAFDSMNER